MSSIKLNSLIMDLSIKKRPYVFMKVSVREHRVIKIFFFWRGNNYYA